VPRKAEHAHARRVLAIGDLGAPARVAEGDEFYGIVDPRAIVANDKCRMAGKIIGADIDMGRGGAACVLK
jgi:hypothetical protein